MLMLCMSAAFASSLARSRAGPAIDVAAGIGWSGSPDPVAVAGSLSAGAWFGRYDDDFAIGRHWWLGATGRVRGRAGRVELAPMLEVRRGIDLLVAGVQGFVAGGVVVDVAGAEEARPVGFTAIGGLVTRYRRTRHVSALLRLEGGVDVVDGRVTPVVGATVGVGWARPAVRSRR